MGKKPAKFDSLEAALHGRSSVNEHAYNFHMMRDIADSKTDRPPERQAKIQAQVLGHKAQLDDAVASHVADSGYTAEEHGKVARVHRKLAEHGASEGNKPKAMAHQALANAHEEAAGAKMSKSTEGTPEVTDADLLKALGELQDAVSKGDRLLEADTEGGLSTVGTPLSKKAPKGVSKAEAGSDDDSSDDGSMVKATCDHVHKGQMACKACSIAKAEDDSSDDASDDDSSGDSEKSIRVDENKDVKKAIKKAGMQDVDAAKFLRTLAEGISDSVEALDKSIEDRFASDKDERKKFDTQIAKALVQIGNLVNSIAQRMAKQETALQIIDGGVQKALSQPAAGPAQRIGQSFSHMQAAPTPYDGRGNHPILNVDSMRIQNWFASQAAANNYAAVNVGIEYEEAGNNPAVLINYPDISKAIVADCGLKA